jgi:hypothetical protein
MILGWKYELNCLSYRIISEENYIATSLPLKGVQIRKISILESSNLNMKNPN